jgi:tRNA (guanine-N7-)-methyltransferase
VPSFVFVAPDKWAHLQDTTILGPPQVFLYRHHATAMTTIDFKKYPKPRSRQHVSPNQYLPKDRIRIEPNYYPPLRPHVAWREHFTNAAPPKYLDIGCGMGRFLLETALEEPSVNILGLEVREYAALWIRGVIEGERPNGTLGNAEALWYSVANGLPFIATASIEKIFYFFPDPWFKKRHHYRRAFTPAFLDECARVLAPDGVFYLMTDVPDVDEYQRETLRAHGVFTFEECNTDEAWGLRARTDQEDFSLRKNIPYVRLRCRKSEILP